MANSLERVAVTRGRYQRFDRGCSRFRAYTGLSQIRALIVL